MVGGLRTDFEFSRQSLAGHNQRVVACRRHWGIEPAENGLPIVLNRASLAVHQSFRAYDLSAEGRANCLMPQANAKQRNFARKVTD